MKGVIITNMIPPYRIKVYDGAANRFPGSLEIVTCTDVEKGRDWKASSVGFHHEILPGLQIKIGRRIIHLNPGIWRYLQKAKPDVICGNGFTPTLLAALAFARMKDIPIVLSMDSWLGSDANPMTPMHRQLRKYWVPRIKVGVALGWKGREWFEAYGLHNNKVYVYPLVPSWRAPTSLPNFDERTFDVIWCGWLGWLKGIDIFTEIMRLVRERRGALRVRIVGDGPDRESTIGELMKSGIDVRFDGFCDADQVCKAFSSARVFLFPTRHDTWGLVAHEAAQCGTPTLISPAAGAAEDIIRDSIEGYVIDLNAQQRWVDRTVDLLNDRTLWEGFSRRGRARTADVSANQAADVLVQALLCAVEDNSQS